MKKPKIEYFFKRIDNCDACDVRVLVVEELFTTNSRLVKNRHVSVQGLIISTGISWVHRTTHGALQERDACSTLSRR